MDRKAPSNPPKKAFSHALLRRWFRRTSSPPRTSNVPVCTELNQSKFPLFCFSCMLALPFILVFISSTHKSGSRILAPLESYKIPLDSEFCEGITLSAQTSYAQLFVFANEPPLTEVISDQFNRSFVLTPVTFKNWYWSLFVNSHILLYVCAQPDLRFFVIRGDQNFSNWKNDPTTYDASDVFFGAHITQNCTYHKENKHSYNLLYTLNVTVSDSYYFIFSNDNETNLNAINFTAFLDRRGYDTAAPIRQCEARSQCSLSLNYGGHEVAIVKTPPYNLEKKKKKDQTNGVLVTYSCDWRPSVYISIIAAIFVGAIVFTLFCLYFIRPRMGKVFEPSHVESGSRSIDYGYMPTASHTSHNNSQGGGGKRQRETPKSTPKSTRVGNVQYHSLSTSENILASSSSPQTIQKPYASTDQV